MHKLKLSSAAQPLQALLDQFQAWLETENSRGHPGFRVSLFLYLQAIIFALTEMALEEAAQTLDAILDAVQTSQGNSLPHCLEEQVRQLRQQVDAHSPLSLQIKRNGLAGPPAGHGS